LAHALLLFDVATLLAQAKPSLTDGFFGRNDPRYPPDAQNQRRRDMRDALVNVTTDAFKGGQLVPLARMNDGFMRPKFPEQLLLSYYQASLLCC
ncbi:MAG: hypothetical protein QN720_13815, partial [Nitrososphaeraceae archaeon]|nr:hypothetical protein [Nitrososphaeraceae archaeon]